MIAQKLETNLNELYEEYDLVTNLDVQMAIGLQQFELHGWKKTSSSAMKFNVKREGGRKREREKEREGVFLFLYFSGSWWQSYFVS